MEIDDKMEHTFSNFSSLVNAYSDSIAFDAIGDSMLDDSSPAFVKLPGTVEPGDASFPDASSAFETIEPENVSFPDSLISLDLTSFDFNHSAEELIFSDDFNFEMIHEMPSYV